MSILEKQLRAELDMQQRLSTVYDSYSRVASPENTAIPDSIDAQVILPGMQGAVLLPSDYLPFRDAASDIFSRFAERLEFFIRAGGSVVVEMTQRGGTQELVAVRPDAFRSRIEGLGPTYRHYRDKGKIRLGLARCSTDSASALLATKEAAELLPPIRAIVNAPVLTEGDGQPIVLGPGYNREAGGVLVLGNKTPETVELAEAVTALRNLLRDFDFVSPGDEARAIAALVTPALVIGGFLDDPAAIDIAEADKSQAGKGYRQKIVRAIYAEHAYVIAQRNGGVGSVDESLSAALLSGRPFVSLDNVRGRLDSQFLEMAVTWHGIVNVRVPHRGEVPVDARGVLFQITSNGIETTPDLANRASIVRIRKRPANYEFHPWAEGEIIAHVTARQTFYLGCVHAVVRAWLAAGRPRIENSGHDLRAWAGTLDWIVQKLFSTSPLMQGHRAVQERVADRALIWLRAVALSAIQTGRAGQPQTASAIWELGDLEGIELPGAKRELDEVRGRQRVGQLLGRVFRETDSIDLDGVHVTRMEEQHYDESHQKEVTRRVYVFVESNAFAN